MGINFKELKEQKNNTTFETIPENRYNFIIEGGEEKMSKQNKPMIEVIMRIIDEGPQENRKMWHKISLSEKAQIFLLRFLEAAKSDLVDSDSEISVKDIITDLVGKKVNGFVEIDAKGRNQFGGDFKPYAEDEKPVAAGTAKKNKLFS